MTATTATTTTATTTNATSISTSTTPQLQLQLPLPPRLQLQLPLNYTTTTTTSATATYCNHNYIQQHYNYNYKLHHTTPHYIQQLWVRWPLQQLQKEQMQPRFGPSVDSLWIPCITTTHLSYSFLSLKLPPLPCAVLLVHYYINCSSLILIM